MSRNQTSQVNLGRMIKKFFLSSFVVITFIAYVVHQRFANPDSALSPTPTLSSMVASQGASSSGGLPVIRSQPTATSNQGLYKDGVYTGPQVDAYYGLVEVQATVKMRKSAMFNF